MTCPKCGDPSDPRSTKGYCPTHKREARDAWRTMIADKASERDERYAHFADLAQRADEAGRRAAAECIPQPMTVVQHANPLDDSSPIVQSWGPIADGVCGFAWVTIHPGNCSFAHYAKKHLGADKAYYGGVQIWISEYGQSYERKYAYAQAFADVLREDGIKAYASGRLD